MKKLAVLFLSVSFAFGCGSGGIFSAQNIMWLIDTGVKLFAADAVEKSFLLAKDDEYRAYLVWSGVSDSLGDVVLPMLNGESPQISDLNAWAERAWDDLPISNKEVEVIQDAVNIALNYIPADKWANAQSDGEMSGDVKEGFITAFTTLKQEIDEVLAAYSYLESSMAPAEVPDWSDIDRTESVRFEYVK